tara:strand:+ start:315 stop:1172 length:858 start_codon:yes stop_codon:yes gene_type:complete
METQIVGVVNTPESDTNISLVDTAPPVDTSPTGDTSPPALDGIVGFVNYRLQQIACPECVGASQELNLNFSATFHEPISEMHTDWIPPVGSCVENLQETSPNYSSVDVGSQLLVTGPVHSFSVPRIGSGYYQTDNLYESQYDRDGSHSVYSDNLIDGFTFNSSRGFDYIEPESLLYVDMSYAYQAPIYRSGATFYWGPSGSGEKFMIIVAVYTSNGSALLGYVVCVGEDNGYMTIPSAYLSSYPPGSLAAVHMSRESINLSPAQDLGGYIETHMQWEVIGTGHIE